jgi:NRPS condensation-like uncharacterized protein
MRRVLGRIASSTAGDVCPAAPLPPMHAVFPARFRWDEQPEAAERVYEAVMRDYRRHDRPARLPWLEAQSPRRVPRLRRLTLPRDDLEQLLAACRRNDTTVHGALCAAQLRATYQLLSTTEPAALFLSCPVDLRPHLDPVPPIAPTGLYITILGASFALAPSTTFWDLAREVPALMRMQLERGDGHLFFSLYGLDRAPADVDALARFDKMVLATPQGSTVSNVGRVPVVEADPAVEAISFALCPMPYQSVFTSVSTYADQLIVNLVYDAGKQDDAIAQACADSMREQLLAAARGD